MRIHSGDIAIQRKIPRPKRDPLLRSRHQQPRQRTERLLRHRIRFVQRVIIPRRLVVIVRPLEQARHCQQLIARPSRLPSLFSNAKLDQSPLRRGRISLLLPVIKQPDRTRQVRWIRRYPRSRSLQISPQLPRLFQQIEILGDQLRRPQWTKTALIDRNRPRRRPDFSRNFRLGLDRKLLVFRKLSAILAGHRIRQIVPLMIHRKSKISGIQPSRRAWIAIDPGRELIPARRRLEPLIVHQLDQPLINLPVSLLRIGQHLLRIRQILAPRHRQRRQLIVRSQPPVIKIRQRDPRRALILRNLDVFFPIRFRGREIQRLLRLQRAQRIQFRVGRRRRNQL